MKISKYQRVFGVGPIGLLTSLSLLGLLWLLIRRLGYTTTSPWPQSIRIAGMILIALWICWHAWAIKTIRSWWSKDVLCTTGPFRFVRHPMYAGAIFLATPGVAFILKSWMLLLWPILLYLIWSVLVQKEENMMKTVFGQEYERYAAKTRRFTPRFH
jgi:protein-S-isoprenylcysteine O-methyltransferase Ste14